MKYLLGPILISLLLPYTSAAGAVDCFEPSKSLFGDSSTGTPKTDLDLLNTLTKDHVITKVVGCSFGNQRPASSVQVFYGVWSGSKVIDEVGLNRFGTTSSSC